MSDKLKKISFTQTIMVTNSASGTGTAHCPLNFDLTFIYDSNKELTGCSIITSGFGTYVETGSYYVGNAGTGSAVLEYY